MIHIRKLFLTIFLLFSVGITAYSQDPHFSQYYANPLYLNPAFAGTAVCPRLIMNYRNQWPAIPGTYVTYSASYDQHIENMSGGVGLLINSDRAGEGTLTTNTISGIYSYRLQVNRKFSIKAGLQATYFQKSIDWNKLTFGDQIDPKYGFIYYTQESKPKEMTKGIPDFSAGILGYGESVYGGVAFHHLTEPNEGFFSVSKLPMKITAHLGGIIDLERHRRRRKIDDPILSPNILFMKQQGFEELNYGLYLNKYPLVGGLWFRQGFHNPDAFIAIIGIQTSVVKIGYSYDVTVSKLTTASGGSHEISFALQFDCRPKKKRIRAIICPSF
ncbi:MAG: type IX secretion system membrane protein PorP/SprF [Bacteroidales bacterium]